MPRQRRSSHKRMINKFFLIIEKLIDKVNAAVDSMEKPDEIKKITSALKDIKDIGDIMSDTEQKEFDLKMEKLRGDCHVVPDGEEKYGVVILPEKINAYASPDTDSVCVIYDREQDYDE